MQLAKAHCRCGWPFSAPAYLLLLPLAALLSPSLGGGVTVILGTPPEAVRAALPSADASAVCDGGVPSYSYCSLGGCFACNVSGQFSAGNAVDGDPASSWQSPPLSEGDEFRNVVVDVDLGNVSPASLV